MSNKTLNKEALIYKNIYLAYTTLSFIFIKIFTLKLHKYIIYEL